ncbi:MAG: hypothetical protein ABGZ24_05390, partial [Fuerstiella sp.]
MNRELCFLGCVRLFVVTIAHIVSRAMILVSFDDAGMTSSGTVLLRHFLYDVRLYKSAILR